MINTAYNFAIAKSPETRVAAATKRFFKRRFSPAGLSNPEACVVSVGQFFNLKLYLMIAFFYRGIKIEKIKFALLLIGGNIMKYLYMSAALFMSIQQLDGSLSENQAERNCNQARMLRMPLSYLKSQSDFAAQKAQEAAIALESVGNHITNTQSQIHHHEQNINSLQDSAVIKSWADFLIANPDYVHRPEAGNVIKPLKASCNLLRQSQEIMRDMSAFMQWRRKNNKSYDIVLSKLIGLDLDVQQQKKVIAQAVQRSFEMNADDQKQQLGFLYGALQQSSSDYQFYSQQYQQHRSMHAMYDSMRSKKAVQIIEKARIVQKTKAIQASK